MFDLDREVGRWRERQERTSSLAAAELDELEDHLRARVNLEMGLMAVPSRRRAFALACEALGESNALSSEFAKAGTPRWRKVMIAGWAMFGASLVLPAVTFDLPAVADTYGYQRLWSRLLDGNLHALLPSIIVLSTIPTLRNARYLRSRWLTGAMAGLLGAAGIVTLAFGLFFTVRPEVILSFMLGPGFSFDVGTLGPGFWLWAGSLFPVATALLLRARHFRQLQPGAPFRGANEGAIE
ncbi:MAG: hypothetical protein F4187_05245 [Gemmatimonadetes bacterium]|nr:hypothetical protein [Gemmatimonadota bacterium]MYI07294.1 hypothetical protein [Gemmatimonadota bacterium]